VMERTYGPHDLVDDVAELVAAGPPTPATFASIGSLLRRLAAEPDLLTGAHLAALHGTGSAATIIARHPAGPVLMLARFPHEAPTPVHNHNAWGVACVVRGRDRYVRWERLDDGADPAVATVRAAETLDLGPGEVVWFGEPPLDIHSQQGIGEAAWELVLFGRDPDARPRAYFDPETGSVTFASATG
jgi:predicted metal-dependent enzyme (double-stranded beta helix superfamily)